MEVRCKFESVACTTDTAEYYDDMKKKTDEETDPEQSGQGSAEKNHEDREEYQDLEGESLATRHKPNPWDPGPGKSVTSDNI